MIFGTHTSDISNVDPQEFPHSDSPGAASAGASKADAVFQLGGFLLLCLVELVIAHFCLRRPHFNLQKLTGQSYTMSHVTKHMSNFLCKLSLRACTHTHKLSLMFPFSKPPVVWASAAGIMFLDIHRNTPFTKLRQNLKVQKEKKNPLVTSTTFTSIRLCSEGRLDNVEALLCITAPLSSRRVFTACLLLGFLRFFRLCVQQHCKAAVSCLQWDERVYLCLSAGESALTHSSQCIWICFLFIFSFSFLVWKSGHWKEK